MEITDVRIVRAEAKAKATVVLDDALAVHDLRVVERGGRLDVRMPGRRAPSGERLDIVHPLTAEFRDRLRAKVLAAYERAVGGPVASGGADARMLAAVGRLAEAWRRGDLTEVARLVEELAELRDEVRLAS